MNLKREVSGHGPSGGLMIIGEAPGADEVAAGIPFVGMAGRTLRRKLREVGIDPESVRYENVIEYKIKDNKIAPYYYDSAKFKPKEELQEWKRDLLRRIKESNPRVIILAGDTALRAIAPARYWPISKCHCYLVRNPEVGDAVILPSYHPQYVNYAPEFGIWLNIAFQKAKAILDGEAKPQVEEFIPTPGHSEALEFIERCRNCKLISVDIEKNRGPDHKLTAIGLAYSESNAISIPYPISDEVRVALKTLLANKTITKVFQNYTFDCMVLGRDNLNVVGPYADTMETSVLLNPQLKKSLADLGRVYLLVEPWKHKGAWNKRGTTQRDFGLYNCRDAAYTLAIYKAQMEGLRDEGLMEYYRALREPLYQLILPICERGWRVDLGGLEEFKDSLATQLAPLRGALEGTGAQFLPPASKIVRDEENDLMTNLSWSEDRWKAASKEERAKYRRDRSAGVILEKAYKNELVPRKFNPNSSGQVMAVLKELGVKIPRVSKKEANGERVSKESTGERCLVQMIRKHPEVSFLKQLKEYRRLSKLESTYANMKLDPDGKLRFMISIAGTESGRFSSKKTPWDTGLNSQNLPKRVRKLIIPEPGCEMVQVDLKQAELWMVAWLSGDEKLISMLGGGVDVHQYMADIVTEATGIKANRTLGKEINHATSYGIGPDKFADRLLVRCGIAVTRAQAREIIALRFKAFPGIPAWQEAVREGLKTCRELCTPFGRRRTFFGRYDEDLVREALNFIPQSTVSDVLNLAWIRLSQELSNHSSVLQQGHDSLLLETVARDILINSINTAFKSVVFSIGDRVCQIPWEIAVGSNWGELMEIPSEQNYTGKIPLPG